jgi:hypothetical protein
VEWRTYGSPQTKLMALAGGGGSGLLLALLAVGIAVGPKLVRGLK